MSDHLDKFEAELAALRPRQLSRQIASRIEAGLSATWADRSLIAAISAGLVAACVTGAVLLTESTAALPPAAPMTANSAPAMRLGDYSLAMARVDADRAGDFR